MNRLGSVKRFGTTDHMSLVWNYIMIIEIKNRKADDTSSTTIATCPEKATEYSYASTRWNDNCVKPSEVEETFIRQFVFRVHPCYIAFFQLLLLLLW